MPVNWITGYATITIPAGDVVGLPIGISFIGTAFSNAKLNNMAYALQQAD
jgi:amidase